MNLSTYNYSYNYDWWLFLCSHYRSFDGRATTLTVIKGAYMIRHHHY